MALWQFRKLNPNDNSGSSTVDDNFADEQRSNADILVRETIQNPLDARSDGRAVMVRYYVTTVQTAASALARSVFQDRWLEHEAASNNRGTGTIPDRMSFLVIEDFGTSGLDGTYTDSAVDGESENWNAFWFREGEGAKRTKSNGGAGQGKITLYLASQIRTVLAVTRRRSDQKELMFGCTRFKRNYKLPGTVDRWAKEARWGATHSPDELAIPVSDRSFISAVKSELNLRRGDEPGTSFIIPLPHDATINENLIKQAVINEFFFAISRGHLTVEVGDVRLCTDTIEAEAASIGDGCRLTKEYRSFLRLAATLIGQSDAPGARLGWNMTKLTEAQFATGAIDDIKSRFEKGEAIVVSFPVPVKPRAGQSIQSNFRVVVQQAGEDDKTEELFVRQDLAVDSEKKLAGYRAALPVRALTYIDEPSLSDLLVCAEEPTHRSWNSKRQKVQIKYVSPDAALHAVRNAAVRLLALIAPAGRRDETALSMFFADPASQPEKSKGGQGKTEDRIRPTPDKPTDIPRPKPKPVRIQPKGRGFAVLATPLKDKPFQALDCVVEVAYATISGDSWSLWDSADFWLPDERQFKTRGEQVGLVSREGNVLRFRLLAPGSAFAITGFDPQRQLDIRLKYKEVNDGADI